MDVVFKRVEDFEDANQPGEGYWQRHKDEQRLNFRCPCGCEALLAVVVKGPREPVWQWDGNEDLPTISPSIKHKAGCGWHGYLVQGVFSGQCENVFHMEKLNA